MSCSRAKLWVTSFSSNPPGWTREISCDSTLEFERLRCCSIFTKASPSYDSNGTDLLVLMKCVGAPLSERFMSLTTFAPGGIAYADGTDAGPARWPHEERRGGSRSSSSPNAAFPSSVATFVSSSSVLLWLTSASLCKGFSGAMRWGGALGSLVTLPTGTSSLGAGLG